MLLFLGFITTPSTRIRSFPRLLPHSSRFRTTIASKFGRNLPMDQQNSYLSSKRKSALFRLRNVSGYKTDLLEIHAENPTFHIVFVPGNPGVISFYTDFLEALYELLEGAASISAISQISQMKKNWQHGRLFSLDEQIDHKVDFIDDELKNIEVPIVLVAHSVGCYISVELLRRFPEKVIYFVGLYPFLAVDKESSKQSMIRKIAASPFLSTSASSIVALLGLLPIQATRFLLKSSIGKSWSSTAIDALCNNVLQYHTMQNVLFMARTEFIKLLEAPDWAFLRQKQSQIAFLYGDDDHWGPLHMFEEMSKQVPNAVLAIEREGHTHAFSCTEAGSLWVAKYVASLIKSHIPKINSIR